jgi:hypothetical protein
LALGVFLLFLPTLVALTQPVVGPEIVSGPLPFYAYSVIATPGIAMAKDGQGVAIAWAMANTAEKQRIFVARLDATGHVAGSTVEVPVSSEPVDAGYPSIAASETGTGFTLAWMETSRVYPYAVRAVYSRLDADVKSSAPAVLQPLKEVTSPVLVRSGRATWMSVGRTLWQIRPDGSLNGPIDSGVTASDMTIGKEDLPLVVSGRKVTGGFTCSPTPACHVPPGFNVCPEQCRIYQYFYVLDFLAVYKASASQTFSFVSDAQPAVQSNGEDVVVAWFSGAPSQGGYVEAVRLSPHSFYDFPKGVPLLLGAFAPGIGLTRPDMATDGERYVIVWRTTSPAGDHDIVGASIDATGVITPLTIATSMDDERDPSIVAAGNGRFLVAYEKFGEGAGHLAGKFITFGGRPRVGR